MRWLAELGLEMYLCQSIATLVLSYVKVDGQWDEVVFILLTIGFAVVVNTIFTSAINSPISLLLQSLIIYHTSQHYLLPFPLDILHYSFSSFLV